MMSAKTNISHSDNEVLNHIFNVIEDSIANATRKPEYFALLCKNVLNLMAQEQGYEVEKYFEEITPFERVAEDGVAIEIVGHKGDFKVRVGNKVVFPNVKSTMVAKGCFLKSRPKEMGSGGIKIFDFSRTKNASLRDKLNQIGNDLVIIHFAWDAEKLRGCISVTSLQEISDHTDYDVIDLFTGNDAGHFTISKKDVYNTALYNDRVIPFNTSESSANSFLKENKNFRKPSIVELM